MNLCDIQSGQNISGFYLLKQASLRTTAAGKPYLAAAMRSGLTAGWPEGNVFGAEKAITEKTTCKKGGNHKGKNLQKSICR